MPKDGDNARASANTVKNLNEAIGLLRKANAILEKVQAGWSVPDAPERPPVIEALKSVGAQGTHAAGLAKQLLTTMRP
jgi:hypothetical protein